MPIDRVHLPYIWGLTWKDVDPAGRPAFDPAGVAELVRALPPAAGMPPAGTDWRLTDFWYDRMTAALVERLGDWLDDLAERFDRFLPLPAGDLAGWERAVAHLVTAVGDRTHYESGWYGCCMTVLGWFLDVAGIEAGRRDELLEHAVGGRFKSWVEPPRAVVESVADRLARRVAGDHV